MRLTVRINMNKPVLASLLLSFTMSAFAAKPKLAFIIDDIGNKPISSKISTLPKEITLSIIPFSKFDSQSVQQAYREGREVMLHLPMQSRYPAAEPTTITLNMEKAEFEQRVQAAIKRIPTAVAVNNHMGSELTQDAKSMQHLMRILKKQRVGFIDSRTTPKTVAQKSAIEQGVANNRRHVFLDHVRSEDFITAQFHSAVKMAQESQNIVVIIGHPHDITLKTLNELLKKFQQEIELVSISQALAPI